MRLVNGTHLAAALLATVALAACTSASPSPLASECQKVAAVLNDGPDPTADPVGYAEAQILPLESLALTDATLAHRVDQLAAADQQYFDHPTSAADRQAVGRASASLNGLCPGAAP